MKGYESLLMAGKGRCKTLKFNLKDLSSTGRYYEDYRIPKEETMLVYAYSSSYSVMELEGNGTIITDRAIYFHPMHRDWGEENRIPLSTICQYLIFQESPQDCVRLLSKDKKLQIFGHTVALSDTTGAELVELLTYLQQHLMLEDKKERKRYEYTLAWALSYVKKSMKEMGRLTQRHHKLLRLIGRDHAFSTSVVLLLAEDAYREMEEGHYQKFLDSLQGAVPQKFMASLGEPDTLFYNAYVEDLSGTYTDQMTKMLVKPYGNLLRKMELSLHEAVILCLLCIRMDDAALYEPMMRAIRDNLSSKRLWQISGFRAKYYKEKMSLAFEKMLTGQMPTKAMLQYRDDMGFTCLHYALMLRNKELLMKVLQAKDWGEGEGPIPGRKLVDCAYQYFFCAVQIYQDPQILQLVLAYTKREALPLLRAIRRIDNFIDISNKRCYKAREKMRFRVAEKQDAFHQGNIRRVRELEDEIADLKDEIASCEDRKEELAQMRSEIGVELKNLLSCAIQQAKMEARILKEADDPLTNYILQLYGDEELLFSSFTQTAISWRLVNYKDLYFVLPEGFQTSIPYVDYENQQMVGMDDAEDEEEIVWTERFINPREAERIERERKRRQEEEARRKANEERKRKEQQAYRGAGEEMHHEKKSWFSAAAKKDFSVLKKEYRILVKKYHPDATGDGTTAILLQQIMEERARILENM
jgi:hypothetical protein